MTLYEILGVDRTATLVEIRRAYKQRVKDCHPDAGGSDAKFRELRQAYDILKDHKRRAAYDRDGSMEEPPLKPDIVLVALNAAFDDVVRQAKSKIAGMDIVMNLTAYFESKLELAPKYIAELVQYQQELANMDAAIRKRPAERDYIADVLMAKSEKTRLAILELEEELVAAKLALELLATEYEGPGIRVPMQGSPFTLLIRGSTNA